MGNFYNFFFDFSFFFFGNSYFLILLIESYDEIGIRNFVSSSHLKELFSRISAMPGG